MASPPKAKAATAPARRSARTSAPAWRMFSRPSTTPSSPSPTRRAIPSPGRRPARWASRARKSTPYAAQMAAEDAGMQGCASMACDRRGHGLGPGFGPRVGAARAADRGLPRDLDPRRDADPAQWLPSAQAPARLIPEAARWPPEFCIASISPSRRLSPGGSAPRRDARLLRTQLAITDQAREARRSSRARPDLRQATVVPSPLERGFGRRSATRCVACCCPRSRARPSPRPDRRRAA
jgi:hypothetical protein